MADWMFDRSGQARIIFDNDKIRSAQGRHRLDWRQQCFLASRKHLGWFEGGVMTDSRDCPIAFLRQRTAGLPSVPGHLLTD